MQVNIFFSIFRLFSELQSVFLKTGRVSVYFVPFLVRFSNRFETDSRGGSNKFGCVKSTLKRSPGALGLDEKSDDMDMVGAWHDDGNTLIFFFDKSEIIFSLV